MRVEYLKSIMIKMMGLHVIIAVLLSYGSIVFAQQQEWQPHLNGTDIYYNSGNVGIGTDTPAEKLDVNGSIKVPSTNWSGIYFGDTYSGLAWRPFGGGNPAITSNTLVLGDDGFLTQIYYDTIWDGAWAYCEGVPDTGTSSYMVNCSNYAGTMTSNDNFWVWKNGHNATPESRKDLKFVFDGESNDGVMGFMEDEDYFYFDNDVIFNDKVGIGTTAPIGKVHVNVQGVGGDGQIALATEADIDLATSDVGDIEFAHYNPTTGLITNRDMVIGANGNVGIGTTNPGQKLAVVGNIEVGGVCFSPRLLVRCLLGSNHLTWIDNGSECSSAGGSVEGSMYILAQCN